jgi:DHA1 family tetracycline resistance protein-like MFS transporter
MKESLKNKLTVTFLALVILIDFMGMATVVVLFPKLLLGASGIFPAQWSNEMRLIMMGIFLAIYPLGQVIGASALGKLSDLHGRKKILLMTLFGTFLGFSLSGIAVLAKSAVTLFVSRLISGLCAGNVAIAQASLMDISTPETKAKNISCGQIAMGSAYIVGPILGGWLSEPSILSWFNMSTPFWFFSAIVTLLFITTSFFYKETNTSPRKENINLLESVQQIYSALTSKRLGAAFFIWLTFVSGWWLFESFMPAFLMQSFNYNTIQIGNVLAFNGGLYALFQYLVVQRIAKKMQPTTMISYFTIFAGISIVSIALTTSTIQLYLAMSIFVMSMGFAIPGTITYISNLADKSDQGQVMGMVSSIQAISTVIVMLAGGYLNSINSNITVISGGILVILSWLSFVIIFPKKTQSKLEILDV